MAGGIRVEHYPALRLRDLRGFCAGQIARVEWPGPEVAAQLSVCEHSLRIDFDNPEHGFFGGPIDIVKRRAGFGGRRTFFLCPDCARARTALYLRRGRFRCRECHGLRYMSQTRDYSSRQHDAMAKLEARLNDDGSKPKRMRWSTFNGICDQLRERDEGWARTWLYFSRKGMLDLSEFLREESSIATTEKPATRAGSHS